MWEIEYIDHTPVNNPSWILKIPLHLHLSCIVTCLNTCCPSSHHFGSNNKILVGIEWCSWVMSTSSLHTGYLDFLLMLFTSFRNLLWDRGHLELWYILFLPLLQCLPYLDKVVSIFFKVADQYRTIISRLEAHYIIDYPIVGGSSPLPQTFYGMKIRQFSRELRPFFWKNVRFWDLFTKISIAHLIIVLLLSCSAPLIRRLWYCVFP